MYTYGHALVCVCAHVCTCARTQGQTLLKAQVGGGGMRFFHLDFTQCCGVYSSKYEHTINTRKL